MSARDAFHPSIQGLHRIAATAWKVGFAYASRAVPTVTAATSSAGADIEVTLSANAPAGIAGIEYRTRRGPYAAYSAPVALPPGQTLTYRSVDRNGNVSAAWALTAPDAG